MDIEKEKSDNLLIFKVSGKIDHVTTNHFKDNLTEVLKEGHKKLILDLTQVNYISSIGLRAILEIAQQLQGMNGKIAFICTSRSVFDVFDFAGFNLLFPIVKTLEEARTAISEK